MACWPCTGAERDAFTADHLRILLAISSKIALSMENALKYQQAESSATTDYLTGLPNARSLFVHLSRELARCRRTGTSLAVMVCDLDNFKQINDLYGHLEGDNLLKDFAAHLNETCRGYDYVARMGGDEFVVVAPGLNQDASIEKARRLNQLAIEAGIPDCGPQSGCAQRGHGFLSAGWLRRRAPARRSRPPHVLDEAASPLRTRVRTGDPPHTARAARP